MRVSAARGVPFGLICAAAYRSALGERADRALHERADDHREPILGLSIVMLPDLHALRAGKRRNGERAPGTPARLLARTGIPCRARRTRASAGQRDHANSITVHVDVRKRQ
jgi:hypothetical protein